MVNKLPPGIPAVAVDENETEPKPFADAWIRSQRECVAGVPVWIGDGRRRGQCAAALYDRPRHSDAADACRTGSQLHHKRLQCAAGRGGLIIAADDNG